MRYSEIQELRINDSLSYSELAALSGYSKTTISKICKGLKPKNPSRLRDKSKANAASASAAAKAEWVKKKRDVAYQATIEWLDIQCDPRMMLFLGLYWGDGKKHGCVRISNNDPTVILICKNIFNRFCPDTDLRFNVSIYQDHNAESICVFWEEFLGIRPHIHQIHDKRSKRKPGKCKYGLANLGLSDWRFETRVRTWIKHVGKMGW